MSEAERSIAVKRKVAVTKPMSRDDSPSEVYSPKRKRSREEASPPPYIPSKKESAGRFTTSSTSSKRTEPRALSRDDARHTLSREDRRELISKSRREELLRTIGINKESPRKAAAARSPEKDDRSENTHRDRSDNTHRVSSDNTHRDINVTFKREVKSDRNSGTVKNFQITTRVVSQRAVARSEERQSSPSPEPRRSLTVQGREVNSKSSVIARLGKVVVERKDSVEDDDEEVDDERDSRATVVRASASQRDAREDIKAKAALSKSQTSVGRKPGARSISQQARDAVQKQCQAAVISVTATRDKSKGSDSPDRREVHCDRESYVSDEDNDERHDVMQTERKSVQMKAVTNRDVSDSPSRGQSNQSDDEAEDLDKMIDDDDLEPALLDDTHNDEFTLDLDDDDISNVVGVIEEEAAEADKLAKEKSEETKAGTRFIVTLDGVDERQFDGADSSTTFDKLRRPPLGSNPIPVAPVAASNLAPAGHNQKLFLDILAAQGRPLPHTLLQQAQTSPSLQAKLTPPKIQPFSISLKDSDDEHDDKESKSASVRHESYHQPQGELEEDVGISALKRARLSERCKFWPACAAGTACDYHHPTTHCKTFPNCKFGDKCLFIHPNCKFDAKCARPDCPYTHTSRRGNVTSAAHVIAIPQSHFVFSPAPPKPQYPYLGTAYPGTQTVCRYFPNCHNLTCPFVHPKPCRFGMACNSPVCPFYHPPVPGKDKLKWQAQSSQHKVAADATTGQVKTELLVSKVSSATSVSQSTGVSSTSL